MPKTNFKIIRNIFLASIALAVMFVSGYYIGNKNYISITGGYPKLTLSRDLPTNHDELDFNLFWTVWDTLEEQYFDKDKIIPAKLVYGAIQGMVAAVEDPYTVFLPPQQNKLVQEDLRGSFGGVGIQIGFKGTTLAVIAPLPDSPADLAGIEAGDLIVGIKDENNGVDQGTAGISLPDAVKIIRGPEGSVVTLTLIREGEDEPIVVDVTRGLIDVESTTLDYVGEQENIAHIRLLKFSGETFDEWEEVVLEVLKKKDLDGIVLDLRNNPGGFLQGSVDIAGEFLDNGTLVVTEESGDGERREYISERFPRLKDANLVILVNEGSASASEILSGALRDQLGSVLIGDTTFGKGTIQEPQQVNSGSALHITIARWLTPEDIWVNEVGLTPDIEIENDPETEKDEQLDRAIEYLREASNI